MKKYSGRRAADGSAVVTREDGSSLPSRLDLCNHSASGFDWGSDGPGPAQLALAILADCLEGDEDADEDAVAWHEDFKCRAIVPLPKELPWSIDEDYVRKIADEIHHKEIRTSARKYSGLLDCPNCDGEGFVEDVADVTVECTNCSGIGCIPAEDKPEAVSAANESSRPASIPPTLDASLGGGTPEDQIPDRALQRLELITRAVYRRRQRDAENKND